ncbi:hypothetical protein AMATHDRAFT_146543 [Amanita thiersii Skay4041]|uniref:DUF155 domain-containing protein n=1 Tax=Amanita thiersii Skay4041 TaxID=703135 RepID=A0A2A9NH36_9AGAR|nr:hypothetical protein AMATHDRAFT_146543 [Amanita thiersii Skay4041]
MSNHRDLSPRLPSTSQVPNRRRVTGLASLGGPATSLRVGVPLPTRRASGPGLTTSAPKAQRTSKTSQKLVLLPSTPQTRPLDEADEILLGHETDKGIREYKSEAERMSKEQRKQAGFKRITAYCVAESFRMKHLASFMKREHNVAPRIFDEALYAAYYLPLLPGYDPNVNVRSSAPSSVPHADSYFSHFSEAEENGYQGAYFTSPSKRSTKASRDGYIPSTSPVETIKRTTPARTPLAPSDVEAEADSQWRSEPNDPSPSRKIEGEMAAFGEVIFFEYGVAVFFGLEERQEMDILEDIDNAGIMRRKFKEDDWEVEECHFAHDPHIAYPRIYNDFFTLKSRSHLLKLSIAHAFAQSTLLAHFETDAQRVLSSPQAMAIPRQLAQSGGLRMRRHEALRLTGRLFKLRRDVNLVSNVLDVPELFWDEASLKDLYDAVREYMEIKPRVQVLNEKLAVASDFLDAIHDHLNNSAMERITWIVIWLIVVAILVELGEVVARLVVHATMGDSPSLLAPRGGPMKRLGRLVIQSWFSS